MIEVFGEIIDKLAVVWNANTLSEYLIALIVFVGLAIFFKILDSSMMVVVKRLKNRGDNKLGRAIIYFVNEFNPPFYFYLSFYVATMFLIIPASLNKILSGVLFVFLMFYVAKGSIKISSVFLDVYQGNKAKKNGSEPDTSTSKLLKFFIRAVVWVSVFLIALSNFGVEITPILAGLGLGGIAIGLALQNVLGELFASLAIYFDKPFKEGDFIIVGNDMGTVKSIGVRSTKIDALGGQQLVISNSELTSTRINNYKKMSKRRVVFAFGVEYKTKVEQLKKIKELVKKIIDKEEHATIDRVHFKAFGASSLDFEVVYYVDTNDYNVYMDTQEKINLEIKKQVEKMGVDFAFPSTSVYMKK